MQFEFRNLQGNTMEIQSSFDTMEMEPSFYPPAYWLRRAIENDISSELYGQWKDVLQRAELNGNVPKILNLFKNMINRRENGEMFKSPFYEIFCQKDFQDLKELISLIDLKYSLKIRQEFKTIAVCGGIPSCGFQIEVFSDLRITLHPLYEKGVLALSYLCKLETGSSGRYIIKIYDKDGSEFKVCKRHFSWNEDGVEGMDLSTMSLS